jgi:luciferase family oxidoreductase group 1
MQNYLNDQFEQGTVQEKVRAMPQAATVPQQWILSSSGQSGLFAAHFGMAFSFAHFINPVGGATAVKQYRARFQPSVNLKAPEANMAIFYFCSEDEEQVMKQRAVMDHRFLQFEKGVFEAITFEEIKDVKYSAYEQERIAVNRLRTVIGNKEEVKKRLTALANEYGVDEIMLVNIASEFKERLRSYELAAELFELNTDVSQ